MRQFDHDENAAHLINPRRDCRYRGHIRGCRGRGKLDVMGDIGAGDLRGDY
jgi:hypothetical protein